MSIWQTTCSVVSNSSTISRCALQRTRHQPPAGTILMQPTITMRMGYAVSADRRSPAFCVFEIMRTDSLNIRLGGTTGNKITFPDLALKNERGEPNSTMVAACAAINDETINIADLHRGRFRFFRNQEVDERPATVRPSFLTVRLKNHETRSSGTAADQCDQSAQQECRSVFLCDQRLAESLLPSGYCAHESAPDYPTRRTVSNLHRAHQSRHRRKAPIRAPLRAGYRC